MQASASPQTAIKRIGILTGGGDAPGLNAVIRAVVKSAANCHCEVIGLEDSFDGLIEPDRWRRLTLRDVTGILRIGGTILGTANRGNPFAYAIETSAGTRDYSARCIEMYHHLALDALIVIGGDGTLTIAYEFYKRGMQTICLFVDAQNPTGATRLYEKAGMHVAAEYVIYEKELRAGRNIDEE